MANISISVIVVTYESASDIAECLKSIPERKDCEVLVIDNNSRDETVQIVRREFPRVRLIVNKKNLGYARANNQGIKESQGRYILLLNPDTTLNPEFIEKTVDFMEKNPTISVLAPKILNPDGTVQDSIREFPDYKILFWEITGLAKIFPKSSVFGRWRMRYFDYTKLQEVPQPMASALLLRRDVLERVGSFDEEFPIYYNDVDLLKRIKESGLKVFYFPEADLIHKRGGSTRLVWKRMIFEQHKSLYQYFKKHKKGKLLYPFFLFTAIIRLGFCYLKI